MQHIKKYIYQNNVVLLVCFLLGYYNYITHGLSEVCGFFLKNIFLQKCEVESLVFC